MTGPLLAPGDAGEGAGRSEGLPSAAEVNAAAAGMPSSPEDRPVDGLDAPVPLIPARMLNELAYCPRLFFLEWVEGSFADNADTVEGRFVHRVVDRPGGLAPPADPESGDTDLRAARQLSLSSERLGLVGRIDVLEGVEGGVEPVDYKRGSPPDRPERAWEPERVQVCALGLLLRDNGYRCERGWLSFVEARQRVEVVFDEALVARTVELLGTARTVAASDLPPMPLVDSPKCPRCSLVGICLPDETNLLLGRTGRQPRRLTPRDMESRPLYITAPGAEVGIRDGRLVVRIPDRGAPRRTMSPHGEVRLLDVSQVCLFGNVQVTTQALRELFDREIPVLWFSWGGWLEGVATGMISKHVELRRRQVVVAAQGGLEIARRIVGGKIRNSRTLLRRNGRPAPPAALESLARLAGQAAEAETAASLLGVEGAAARLYFQAFTTMLRPDLALPGRPFAFEGRNRRPPTDAVNCLLSFAYALLVKDLVSTLIGVGLDPFLGMYHRPRFGRPALALDLAEEFRPLIAESIVVTAINNGEARASHFVVRAGGVSLTGDGRKAIIACYDRRLDVEVRHPVFGYRITYRRVLEVQARVLAAHLVGELDAYLPFSTR